MGQLVDFYAGDAAEIGSAFAANEWTGLRDGTRARADADFSLHLSPTDLDLSSAVIAEHVGAAPRLLNDSMTANVGGRDGESSADVVDPAWVRLVASANEANAPALTAEWIKRVGAECGEQLGVTVEAVRAVGELIRLCQQAVREELEVVHTWSL